MMLNTHEIFTRLQANGDICCRHKGPCHRRTSVGALAGFGSQNRNIIWNIRCLFSYHFTLDYYSPHKYSITKCPPTVYACHLCYIRIHFYIYVLSNNTKKKKNLQIDIRPCLRCLNCFKSFYFRVQLLKFDLSCRF